MATHPVTRRTALIGETLTPQGRKQLAVVMQDGKIEKLVDPHSEHELPADRRRVDGLIAPGFIDLQNNGSFGKDVMLDEDAIGVMKARLPETGVTSFLPTLICSPKETYRDIFQRFDAAASTPGANALGLHLEGPFFSPQRKGMHELKNLRPIDLGFIQEMADTGKVKMMTLAPELEGALEAIPLLERNGIVASAGHTNATWAQMEKAADAGLRTGTHLFNAQSGSVQHRGEVPAGTLEALRRAPQDSGASGAILTDERFVTGIITDNVHVSGPAMRLAYEAKGVRGLFIVTDAMGPAGTEEGIQRAAGQPVMHKGGEIRLLDGGGLAGSAATMDECVRVARREMGATLDDAIRMATETPADVLKLPNKGRIEPGADADLVVLSNDDRVEVRETWVAGENVFTRGAR